MGTSRHTARLAAVAVAVGALGAGSGQASAAATRTTTHTQPGSVTILDPYTGDVSPDTLAFVSIDFTDQRPFRPMSFCILPFSSEAIGE
jgi:hypothetical protein